MTAVLFNHRLQFNTKEERLWISSN